jgi:hypothetical protein
MEAGHTRITAAPQPRWDLQRRNSSLELSLFQPSGEEPT